MKMHSKRCCPFSWFNRSLACKLQRKMHLGLPLLVNEVHLSGQPLSDSVVELTAEPHVHYFILHAHSRHIPNASLVPFPHWQNVIPIPYIHKTKVTVQDVQKYSLVMTFQTSGQSRTVRLPDSLKWGRWWLPIMSRLSLVELLYAGSVWS